jgi:hypothetical protein
VRQWYGEDQRKGTKTHDDGGGDRAPVTVAAVVAAEAGEEGAERGRERHFEVVVRKKKGRERPKVDIVNAYCAAAISRRRSSPRSGAINEVPVKLELFFYTSEKAKSEWYSTIVH